MAIKTAPNGKSEKKTQATVKKPTQEIIKAKMMTRIQVKCDAGFGNTLNIRGQGADLSWGKGIPLKNIKNDEWLFETDKTFLEIEFKILLNDLSYETGQNHLIRHGNYLQYHPKF